MNTDIPTAELDRLDRKHRKDQTWDSGNPEAVDGYVTWCKGCHQRPWPCDSARLLAAARQPEPARKAALREAIELTWPCSNCCDGHNAIRAALTAPSPSPEPPLDERKLAQLKRLQSAHHRMLGVTAITCDACRKERASTEPSAPE